MGTTPPWQGAKAALAQLVDGWLDRALRLRPARRKAELAKLERALSHAVSLAKAQVGPTAPPTQHFATLLREVGAARRGKSTLTEHRPALVEALSGLSSALVFLEPDVREPVEAFTRLWDELGPPPGSTWIDLGCGAGATMAALAQRYPDATFVGVEIDGADAPETAIRLPREPDPAKLSALTVAEVGAGSASRVSLLYPLHRRLEDHTGRRGLAHQWQLDTALALLEPGGRGILITEDPVAWGTARAYLNDHPDAGVGGCGGRTGGAPRPAGRGSGSVSAHSEGISVPPPRCHPLDGD